MRRLLLFFTLTLLFSGQATGSTVLANDIDELKGMMDGADRLLVHFEEEKAAVEDAIENSGGEIIRQISNETFVVSIDEDNLNEMERELEDIDTLVRVGVDASVRAFLDLSIPYVRGDRSRTTATNGLTFKGENVGVCVIDTGVDYTHTDLGGCTQASFLAGTCSKVVGGYDFVNGDNNPMDDNGHGTHVAGIVAANGTAGVGIQGMAPEASIIAIKVLNSNGAGVVSDIASAIEWCTDNATLYNISIITMSLGSEDLFSSYCDSDASWLSVSSLVDAAVDANITVIAATGNDGSVTAIGAPACIENIIAVAATDLSDEVYYNRNAMTDLVAPGLAINSTVPAESACTGSALYENCDDSRFASYPGTSMAAPHVAGAAALLVQAQNELNSLNISNSEVLSALNDTGIAAGDTGGGESGLIFRRIDAFSAILSLDSVPPNNPTDTYTTPDPDSNSILINWSLQDEAVNYSVYRSNSTGVTPASYDQAWTNIGNVAGMNDTIPTFGKTFYYTVTGTDTAGNENTTEYVEVTGSLDSTVPSVFVSLRSSDDGSESSSVYDKSVYANVSAYDASAILSVKYRVINASDNSQQLIPWTSLSTTGDSLYAGFNISGMLLPVSNWTIETNATDAAGNSNSTSMFNFTSNTKIRATWISDASNSTLGNTFWKNYTVETKGYPNVVVMSNISCSGCPTTGALEASDKTIRAQLDGSSSTYQASSVTSYSGASAVTLQSTSLPSEFSSDGFAGVYSGNVTVFFDLTLGYDAGMYSGTLGFGLSDA